MPRAIDPQFPARFSLTLTTESARELRLARVDDGIEATARIRAMVWLWANDARFRSKVDSLAAEMIANAWRMQNQVRARQASPDTEDMP